MALGELTKGLAQQALGSLRAPDAPAAQGDNLCATIFGQIQAMQKALKDDQELIVLFSDGTETVRVQEFYAPSSQVVVLTGIDSQKNVTRVISPIASMRFICKIVAGRSPGKARPDGFDGFLPPRYGRKQSLPQEPPAQPQNTRGHHGGEHPA